MSIRDNMPEGMKHLFDFMFRVGVGKLPERETLEFLQSAFIAISQGKDANEALELGRKGCRRNRTEEYVSIALAVELQRPHCDNYSAACEIVAKEFSKSLDTVIRRHEEYKHEARGLIECLLDNLKLKCSVMVEKEHAAGARLYDAIIDVSLRTGVAPNDIVKWHDEFLRDDYESCNFRSRQPPTDSE